MICKLLYANPSAGYKELVLVVFRKNCDFYLDYLGFCQHITEQQGFDAISASINEKVGYDVTPFRAAELVMFENGGKDMGGT
ncbi:MAG: hypothetical protein JNK77_03165 [Saprospiraceae bacterium]|nr:hypothetical protein [Saprospiraceae bacterium]